MFNWICIKLPVVSLQCPWLCHLHFISHTWSGYPFIFKHLSLNTPMPFLLLCNTSQISFYFLCPILTYPLPCHHSLIQYYPAHKHLISQFLLHLYLLIRLNGLTPQCRINCCLNVQLNRLGKRSFKNKKIKIWFRDTQTWDTQASLKVLKTIKHVDLKLLEC